MGDLGRTARRASLVIALAAMPVVMQAQAGTGTTGGQTGTTTGTTTGTATYGDDDDRDRGGFPWGLLGLLGLLGLAGRKRDDRTVHVRDDRGVADRGTTGRV